MKILLVGYGAMGKNVCELAKNDIAYICAPEVNVKDLDNANDNYDVVLDFSNPNNLDMICDFCQTRKIPVVFATTGFTQEQENKINQLSKNVPVLKSANFSLGVILINKLVKQITPILKDDFDIEIVEAHHNKKLDSPSGTAKMLLNSAVEATNYSPKYGRVGNMKREANEIGVHSIRGGTIVGEHEVLYCGEDEIISIKHQANSKKIFAKGALLACKYIVNKENGLYDMEDVLFN